jgi:hypothetical protein
LGDVAFSRAVMPTGHSIHSPVALWIKSNTSPLRRRVAANDVAMAVFAQVVEVLAGHHAAVADEHDALEASFSRLH